MALGVFSRSFLPWTYQSQKYFRFCNNFLFFNPKQKTTTNPIFFSGTTHHSSEKVRDLGFYMCQSASKSTRTASEGQLFKSGFLLSSPLGDGHQKTKRFFGWLRSGPCPPLRKIKTDVTVSFSLASIWLQFFLKPPPDRAL